MYSVVDVVAKEAVAQTITGASTAVNGTEKKVWCEE